MKIFWALSCQPVLYTCKAMVKKRDILVLFFHLVSDFNLISNAERNEGNCQNKFDSEQE